MTRIQTWLTSLSIAALVASTAHAADFGGGPRGTYVPPPVEPRLQLEQWTGFYLGAAIGASTTRTGIDGSFGVDTLFARGWDASILAGYNWQIGRTVIGVEGDIGTGRIKGSRSNGLNSYTADFDTLGSLRARAGYLLTPSFMVYATGGFAYAHANIALEGAESTKQWFTGWQAGLGTELKLDARWSLRLEYLYTDFGAKTLTQATATGAGLTNSFDPTMHTVRAGLTFKF